MVRGVRVSVRLPFFDGYVLMATGSQQWQQRWSWLDGRTEIAGLLLANMELLSSVELTWSGVPGRAMACQANGVMLWSYCIAWNDGRHAMAKHYWQQLHSGACCCISWLVGMWYLEMGYGLGLVVVWWRRWMMAWWLHIHTNDDMMCGVVRSCCWFCFYCQYLSLCLLAILVVVGIW